MNVLSCIICTRTASICKHGTWKIIDRRQHIGKIKKLFDISNNIWSASNNGNKENDSCSVHLFISRIQSLSAPPRDPALLKFPKAYIEWPVEYLFYKNSSRSCSRKHPLPLRQGNEWLSSSRECLTDFWAERRVGVVLPSEWARLHVSTLHFNQELINSRHLEGRSHVLGSPIYQQLSLMLNLLRIIQGSQGIE